MKLRLKGKKDPQVICSSNKFNVHSLDEIIVCFEDGDMDSDYIRNYEVWLEKRKCWKSLSQAFKDHDVIVDNYNTYLFEPENEEDQERGYTL